MFAQLDQLKLVFASLPKKNNFHPKRLHDFFPLSLDKVLCDWVLFLRYKGKENRSTGISAVWSWRALVRVAACLVCNITVQPGAEQQWGAGLRWQHKRTETSSVPIKRWQDQHSSHRYWWISFRDQEWEKQKKDVCVWGLEKWIGTSVSSSFDWLSCSALTVIANVPTRSKLH